MQGLCAVPTGLANFYSDRNQEWTACAPTKDQFVQSTTRILRTLSSKAASYFDSVWRRVCPKIPYQFSFVYGALIFSNSSDAESPHSASDPPDCSRFIIVGGGHYSFGRTCWLPQEAMWERTHALRSLPFLLLGGVAQGNSGSCFGTQRATVN